MLKVKQGSCNYVIGNRNQSLSHQKQTYFLLGHLVDMHEPITKFLEETVCSDVIIITDFLDTASPVVLKPLQKFDFKVPHNFFQSLTDVTVLNF